MKLTMMRRTIRFTLAVLLLPGVAGGAPDPGRELLRLDRTIGEKRREAERLVKTAHADLDAGRYEGAVANHREAVRLLGEADADEVRLEGILEEAVGHLIDELDDEVFAKRSAAAAGLVEIGPRAIPLVREALLEDELDPETQYQLRVVLAKGSNIRMDAQGRFRQWATKATASTEYSNPNWSAMQASGEPDTMRAGDISTAWAPAGTQVGMQWLELEYPQPVVVSQVRVHETYNPGAVVKLEARDGDGELQVLWEGKDTVDTAPAFFEIDVPEEKGAKFRTKTIRITLDTNAVNGYNEIDAVELVGTP